MITKVLYIIGVFLLILFVVQNSSHVPVVFLTGKAHFRSIFLIFGCFGAGFLTGYYFIFKREEVYFERIRHLKKLLEKERRKTQKRLENES